MTDKRRRGPRRAPFRDKVAAFVRENPYCTSQDVAAALDVPLADASAGLNATFTKNITSRARQGRLYHYWLKGAAPPPNGAIDPSAVEELKARLADLEARLAVAESKHPDLRKIDYEAYRPALAAFYDAAPYGCNASVPMDESDEEYIRGLIAAMPLMPKGV